MSYNLIYAGLVLLVGVWGCEGSSKPEADSSDSKGELAEVAADPHTQPLTPDEFGKQLFAVLKDEDYSSIERYVWHEQDWAYISELGEVVPEEKQKKAVERTKKKLREGITRYHEQYFKIGTGVAGGEPIQTVEYVKFITGRAKEASDEYVQYNDSYLVININGKNEERLEIDHIQVIKGIWHISEIK